MNKFYFSSLFIFGLLLSINNEGCKDGFDTGEYHKSTSKLHHQMSEIDSLVSIVDLSTCFRKWELDSLFDCYVKFCQDLEGYDFPDKSGITVDDCVIKKERVKFNKDFIYENFEREIKRLEKKRKDLAKDARSIKRLLKRQCGDQYKECQRIKKSKGNKEIIQTIKELLEIRKRPEQNIINQEKQILAYLYNKKERLNTIVNASSFYKELEHALMEELRFIVSKRANGEHCTNAHIRWASCEKALQQKTTPCEVDHLYDVSSQGGWPTVIDSAWISQQTRNSEVCTKNIKGCLCEGCNNYNANAKIANNSCLGCKDTLALNYCAKATNKESMPCYYAACKLKCYKEKMTNAQILAKYPNFVFGRDSLVQDDALCLTNLCGCTNECADNYNPQALYDDGSCTGSECGCLDPKAVNYARRTSPEWARKKYNKPNVKKHQQDKCIYSGCMSECAVNYDSLATTDTGDCICKETTILDLEKRKKQYEIMGIDSFYSPQRLKEEFEELADKILGKNTSVAFKKVGHDLIVDVSAKQMKIRSRGEQDGIPLGKYHFKPVNQLIDVLVRFLIMKSKGLLSEILRVKIVGEADAKPIRGNGIPFKNANYPIIDEQFMIIPPHLSTDISVVSDSTFILTPNSGLINMKENDLFTENIILAFLRAYMVKQQLEKLRVVPESMISMGAKANTSEGKAYRRINISMTLSGFYEIMKREDEKYLLSVKNLDEAIDFYKKYGEQEKGKTYDYCPCY